MLQTRGRCVQMVRCVCHRGSCTGAYAEGDWLRAERDHEIPRSPGAVSDHDWEAREVALCAPKKVRTIPWPVHETSIPIIKQGQLVFVAGRSAGRIELQNIETTLTIKLERSLLCKAAGNFRLCYQWTDTGVDCLGSRGNLSAYGNPAAGDMVCKPKGVAYSTGELQRFLEDRWICTMNPFVETVAASHAGVVANNMDCQAVAQVPFSSNASLGDLRLAVQALCGIGKIVKLISHDGGLLGEDLDGVVIHPNSDLSEAGIKEARRIAEWSSAFDRIAIEDGRALLAKTAKTAKTPAEKTANGKGAAQALLPEQEQVASAGVAAKAADEQARLKAEVDQRQCKEETSCAIRYPDSWSELSQGAKTEIHDFDAVTIR